MKTINANVDAAKDQYVPTMDIIPVKTPIATARAVQNIVSRESSLCIFMPSGMRAHGYSSCG